MFAHRMGGAKLPEPIAQSVTRWKRPLSQCAYSYVAKGCSGEDYDVLAEPVEDVLYFAGEHTNRIHPTTVSGAPSPVGEKLSRIAEQIVGRWRCRRVNSLLLSP